jgi:hypothetical protein
MPVIGQRKEKVKPPFPRRIARVAVLTYERPGLLSETIERLRLESPGLDIVVYDDGSQMAGKLLELSYVERGGVKVVRMPHEGFLASWRKVIALMGDLEDNDGVVLMEDDVLVAPKWDQTLLSMAAGTSAMGFKPGAMTCLRCHDVPQSEVVELNGVLAYQSMGHGFQVNLFPAWVLKQTEVVDKAFAMAGRNGFDVWLIALLSDVLGLVSFSSNYSWAAHLGAGCSSIEALGSRSFQGVGVDLMPGLARKAAQIQSDLNLI